MTTSDVKPIPEGMNTVTPHLICAGAADAIEFYKKAFGAVEMMRFPGPDGKIMHACIRIGNSNVTLADESPKFGMLSPKSFPGTSVSLHLYVENVDAFAKHAVDAGAKTVIPITDMFWGDRHGHLEDPFGHRWSVATRIKNLTVDEIKKAVPANMECGSSQS